jgi:catechol 2,3-dioxygenase-like lactoylglutathione lyase family enzyme
MKLGKFSVSLTVKDLQKSKAFYKKLGFSVVGGEEQANWLVLSNEQATIGLFQGMFERNILTFNPGWDSNREEMSDFTDVRELQKQLKAHGITFDSEADPTTQGPASFMIQDPDGNPILVDQYI